MIQIRSSIVSTPYTKASQHDWYRPRMTALMLFADLAGLTLAIVFGHLIAADPFNFLFFDPNEVEHVLILGIVVLTFISGRMYPGTGTNPAEEIKLVTQYSSSALIVGMMLNIVLRSAWLSATVTLLSISAFSIINILLLRWLVRIIAAQLGIWGVPVVILARPAQVEALTQYFLQRRRLGFVPVLSATDSENRTTIASRVPVVNLNSLLAGSSIQTRLEAVDTILIDASFFGQNFADNPYTKLLDKFQHIIFISDMGWLEGASLAIRDFEGLIGIEARRNMLSALGYSIKRVMDILGSLLGMLLFSPFLLVIAALIKLDSAGPVFYIQPRIGMHGKRIYIYKFRTMLINAEQALAEYLNVNIMAQCEWEKTQKLRDDPRVTRVGKFLRRYSIDELPQLFNVLLGNMSLVGPRPIMVNQAALYGGGIDTYRGIRPGLTGLWQVSGRNHTTFQERANFDVYYVRHWSVWLDIYILLRTVWVVLSRDGAY
ncbi:MAG: undecaprenyl-phosphate galactose phosphotransferase WbaP [Chloroflexi bacterium]|nr:MAG: undecaprenyl-phosphate galactose phosphotransferase WbaP [Chloroflexota bacterium]